ncbi:hypothetical protein ULF88_07740 [Halopseudomonas pachastrellae]|nr:hypothetical protein [Halopseudomonas pachastrellae]
MGVYVIAAALDHSDTQNAGVYVKSLPDIVGRIDRAVAMELAPYAQAFKGLVIPSEKHALRGGDPSSRVSNGSEKLGNCGSYGFCGALAPVACYTCPHFQPWVDGPHEEVLDGLIAERERVKQLTGDMTIASANDRLIYAVRRGHSSLPGSQGSVLVMAEIIAFVPKAGLSARVNLDAFVKLCRDKLTVFGAGLDWHSNTWPKVGNFTAKGAPAKGFTEKQYLHPDILPFAKSYVRYQQGVNPTK